MLLDNVPSHGKDLIGYNPNVDVIYLPPKTTSLIQPMDQQEIATLKLKYLKKVKSRYGDYINNSPIEITLREFWKNSNLLDGIKIMLDCWREINQRTFIASFAQLLESNVVSSNEYTTDEKSNIILKITEIEMALGLILENEDIVDFVKPGEHELKYEELQEVVKDRKLSADLCKGNSLKPYEPKIYYLKTIRTLLV